MKDKTGLRGQFDFDFGFHRPDAGASSADVEGASIGEGEDFFAAIPSQLGLKLVPKNGSREVLVVDSWKRVPVDQ